MRKSLVVLAILSTMSVPAVAQNSAAAVSGQQPAKAQTVKKRVCYQEEEDSYSRLGGRKICKMVEVPAKSGGGSTEQQGPSATNTPGK